MPKGLNAIFGGLNDGPLFGNEVHLDIICYHDGLFHDI